MDTLAWVSWIVGGVLAAIGLLLAAWSIRGDRSRGRRRCPKCWYDMSKVPGMTCPECGRTPKSERKFARTRRRWKGVQLAGVLVLLGLVAAVTPAAYTGKWVKYTPTPLLKVVVEQFRVDSSRAFQKFQQSSSGASGIAKQSSWEKLLIASECARKLAAFRLLSADQQAREVAASSRNRQWGRGLLPIETAVPTETADSTGEIYDDAEWSVQVLSGLGDEYCIASDELLRLISVGDSHAANLAITCFAALKATAEPLIPELAELGLHGESSATRAYAIISMAIVSTGVHARVPAQLCAAIDEDESETVRVAAIRAMMKIDPTAAQLLPCLMRHATDDSSDLVREEAMRSLGHIGGLEADSEPDPYSMSPSYWRSYRDDDPVLWASYYIPLPPPTPGGAPDIRLLPVCIQVLQDHESRLRTRSATYLDGFGTAARAALPAIDAAIQKETDSSAKQALLQAFLHIEAGPRSVQILTESLEDPKLAERTLRWAFIELGRLGPAAASAVPAIERFIASHDFSLVFAVETLAQIGEAGLPQLLRTLQDSRDGVRIMAASALVRDSMPTCGATDRLIPLMKDASSAVRVYIAKTLAKCPEQWGKLYPPIVEAMRSETSVSARMEYVELLARLGAGHLDEMVPRLASALRDESWQVRLVAAQQLVLLGKDAWLAGPALAKAAQDPDESVRAAAKTAIENLLDDKSWIPRPK